MIKHDANRLELGLGLVSIGRKWGFANVEPPDERQAIELLSCATELGIRVFDTAPAYAASESILGRFLATLSPEMRSSLQIMTKTGEHWDNDAGSPFVDHSIDAMKRSIDRSISLLGEIDVLQIHKASEDVVTAPAVLEAIEYAKAAGIARFGASVSTMEAAKLAIASGLYNFLQFPMNIVDRKFLQLLPLISQAGMRPIINRPFAMGELVAAPQPGQTGGSAFRFLRDNVDAGIVLTGTSKPEHLRENVAGFSSNDQSFAGAALPPSVAPHVAD